MATLLDLVLNADEATSETPTVGTVDIAALAEFLGVMTDAATDPIGFAKELNDKIAEVQKSLGVEPAVVTEEEIVEEAAIGNMSVCETLLDQYPEWATLMEGMTDLECTQLAERELGGRNKSTTNDSSDCTDLISARREAYDDCINAGGNDPECEEMVSADYDAMIGDCFTEQGISDPAWNAIVDEDTYENVQDCLQSHDDEYQQLTCLQEWGYDNLTDAMTDVVMFERGNNSKKSVDQEAIANSVKSLLAKKVALAKRLTVNCSCSITRKKMIGNLVKKPVTELQELLTMIPVRNHQGRGFFDTLPDDAEMLATP